MSMSTQSTAHARVNGFEHHTKTRVGGIDASTRAVRSDRDDSARRVARAAVREKTAVNISRLGRVSIINRDLFTTSSGRNVRDFIQTVLGVGEVENVAILPSEGRAEIVLTRNADHPAVVRKISQLLSGGQIAPLRRAAVADVLALQDDDDVRVYRYGNRISSWAIRHELPGRIRFENPALYRRDELRQLIENELVNTFGIDKFSIETLTGGVLIHYNPAQIQRRQIIELLDGALSKATETKPSPVDLDLPVSVVSTALAATSKYAVPALAPVSAAVFLYSVVPSFKGAYQLAFKEKRLGVDLLDALVVASCLATGQIFAGSVLGLTLSIARRLVNKTESDSKRMLLNVFGKQPRFVWLDVDGVETEVALERVKVGDVIVIHTGESVPVDGEVVDGMAMIDQHAMTGESAPVEKTKGDSVLAATTLIAGKIRVSVTNAGEDTTSAKLAQILNDTSGYTLKAQSKGESLADRAVGPTLALGAVGLATRGVNSAVAVVNCDLGTGIRMAAPIAMLSSLTLCAEHGILVKSGRALEQFSEIDTFLFDKTGTLTRERPEVGRILPYNGYDENDILRWAAAAENKFSHPIARAILDKAKALKLVAPATDDSKYSVGYGITVGIAGKTIRVGSARFIKHEGIKLPGELDNEIARVHDEGHSLIFVGVDDKLGGAIELQSADRPEASEVIEGLRRRGASHLAIISGDHDRPTRKLARRLGMDRYFAEVLPQDKARYVEELQAEGRRVCFIGDGVNDSIALKKANVSISLRGASSIATDTAQIVFMEESLEKVLKLRDVSSGLRSNIDRSWGMILGTNLVCVAGALLGGFGVMHSMMFNQFGGLLAVGNGLLPLREADRVRRTKEANAELLLQRARREGGYPSIAAA